MKSNSKTKTIILITLGIFFAFSPILNNSLNFIMGNNDKSSVYSDEISVDNDNFKKKR